MEHITLLGQQIPRMGLGCWAIGGPFYSGNKAYGYGKVDDKQSIDAIEYAYDQGIRLFDTAPAYGIGHSESILGQALKNKPDAIISSKIGLECNRVTKQFVGPETDPETIVKSIDESLGRLQRERIGLLFLHLNSLSIEEAEPIFDRLDTLVKEGKLGAYGWSTDFSKSIAAMAEREHFRCVQHCMNVFFSPNKIQQLTQKHGLVSFCRSPLAMGLLTGKFQAGSSITAGDIRGQSEEWLDYFKDGKVNDHYIEQLDRIRSALTRSGRTPAQGALAWILRHDSQAVPIPGFRNRQQVAENIAALSLGSLEDDAYVEIEQLMNRPVDYQERER